MLVQERVKSVVMVTQLEENGKTKCARYWPEPGQTETYGADLNNGITVSSSATPEEFDGYTVTVLKVHADRSQGREASQVSHFWYHTWKDHSVPSKAEGLAQMLAVRKAVKLHQETASTTATSAGAAASADERGVLPPIVTHCSAGVGRSGSFLTFDYALEVRCAFFDGKLHSRGCHWFPCLLA
jgi:protein tyrosine phosphatase